MAVGGLQSQDDQLAFRHEALFYECADEYLAGTVPFISDGIAAGEPVLVACSVSRAELLRRELNGEGDAVAFVDMDRLGHNPAHIIPAWRDFVAEHGGEGRPVRGIGEPVWPERSPAELVECQRHEWLLNVAFADAPAWWLLCPYDATTLDDDVLEAAQLTHPHLAERGTSRESDTYCDPRLQADPFDSPLPAPPRALEQIAFGVEDLSAVRGFVSSWATYFGAGAALAEDLVLAVNELATNSLRHAAGRGVLRVWREGDELLCEVQDEGQLDKPLAGRERPGRAAGSSRGLWITNQLCDLVQIRSLPDGNLVRLHLSVD
jgi:anti-sigma regulatory factor (Ser/Thr protein kinase)